ncbi:uncharacterized protein LOC130928864 [Corythoichthys intestinalis]|uniref:uncharacterized protein LOC130928864 n=1 Tax=Corythoichthys intestinalis TaxID=161448 RepID=UPI0025A575DD|nr:uncharacterized protein LOC130928864 [Corythoichthys intestinalis]
MSRGERRSQCGNMKLLLSCLLLASHCALSSRSDASIWRVYQSSDKNVVEGQWVTIECCWTGNNSSRVKVEWLRNMTTFENAPFKRHNSTCGTLVLGNITKNDSGTYVCKVKVDIPSLLEITGNGTIVRVRQGLNGTTDEDFPRSPIWVPLVISLALVLLLLLGLACICKLKQTKGVRVIYESPHLDSDTADPDKRSTGSSTGSSQWCQVLVYESVDYFERAEMKQSG